MNFHFKMVFLWWIWLWRIYRIRAYARKYRGNPDYYTPQQRYDWLLKKVKSYLKMFNIKVTVEGYENLPKSPCLLISNHKSNADALILMEALSKKTSSKEEKNKIATFLAKKKLSKKAVIKNALNLIDAVYIDRQNFREAFESLAKFGSFVKENRTYGVIFPEGTRVDGDGLGEFKAGAFKVAISHYLPIVPVVISDSRDAFNKSRSKKIEIKVKFLSPMKPSSFMSIEPGALADRVRNLMERELENES
ncbi:1-acyl-sn-glycerol-3-phosphate acyltransferase [Mycoplasmopsis caviae]|uniref:1-acyl-sn-glycerol-3-phosphate acyltransferase n=1 Tax=Mycoplasmopsis caviae TaxID=55603 RepID=A0A3P8L764_9BACT|nr:lysophospholipid acyltransferase family protein [Mycoplasmopsis caviae]UUD35222.1 1-acyl-sn-glycerol-3-phosphate acyltransferase [Mycoplasmopsis caviae]VDR41995.1 1-acyl-sn-glycerol-3-phosphate acyltransferase [Mycoplasmopsis caviae]